MKKTSIVFKVPHRPGALFDVLSKFRALDINLIKLESRPIPGRDFEFKFYIDLDVSIYRNEPFELINELDNELDSFDYLGSYTEIIWGVKMKPFGLLGRKLSHSISPEIHNLLCDYEYVLFEREPDELDEFFKKSKKCYFLVNE